MSEVPSRDHRKVRVQAIVVGVVLVASGLEVLALESGAPALGDVLLAVIAAAMLVGAIGG